MSICVGTFDLARFLNEEDPSEHADYEAIYSALADELVKAGLVRHIEPRTIAEHLEHRGELDCFPTRALQLLRRASAHARAGRRTLRPLAPEEGEIRDALLSAEYASTSRSSHLIHFSDTHGFWVPQDFATPFSTKGVVGDVGSTQRLRAELIDVAPLLGIRLASGELDDIDASRLQGWQEGEPFADERVAWFALFESTRKSLAHGSAIRLG